MNVGVSGKYKLVVRNADMSVKQETAWFDNIVTAVGLNALLSGTTPTEQQLSGVAGAGNTTPSLSDTALASYLGPCGSVQSVTISRNTTTAPYSVTKTITFRSAQGGVVGNVSEVGVALGSGAGSSSPLISRSLVVDSMGAQTTVPVQASEYLDMVWSFTIYMGQATGSFNMTIDGVVTSFNYTILPANMTSASANGGWLQNDDFPLRMFANVFPYASAGGTFAFNSSALGAVTSQPSGTQSTGSPTLTAAAYTPGSYTRSHTLKFALNDANFNIGAFLFGLNACAAQMSITPSVAKTNTKEFSITFNISVANYTP